MTLALDIETVPNLDLVDSLPEPEVKYGNTKDPEKRAAIEKQAKAKQVEQMGLNPLTARVITVALVDDHEPDGITVLEPTDGHEADLISWTLRQIEGRRIVTWNGNGFDLPMLYKRALLLGVEMGKAPPLSEMTRRYSNNQHTDLMEVWAGWGKYEKLGNVARQVIGSTKFELDHKQFPKLLESEEGRDKITKYCIQDAAITLELYNRCRGYLFD